jgi:acetyl-CoA carboxylase biotin carboxylase subunit
MLKAAAGGGGKGMRAVNGPAEMEAAFRAATSEAERSFGSGEVYLERRIERPRHIEIQLIADAHGNCIYLGERECSVQRRHQKVIEEAPSAVVSEALRRRMGEAAVRLVLSADYVNAGTVEFLVEGLDADAVRGAGPGSVADMGEANFYFLEMNTRLQVEHPVTELVTGLDLVQMQIRVAEGEPLPLRQEDVRLRGHAIECRVYAEDWENGFMPSPGKITRLVQPGGPGIREDCGVYEGWTVPLEYDPMLSKLVAYAATRECAIDRMARALGEYTVGGIRTNLGLFERVLRDGDFRAGRIDTGYLDRLLVEMPVASGEEAEVDDDLAALAAALFVTGREASVVGPSAETSRWAEAARREGMRA